MTYRTIFPAVCNAFPRIRCLQLGVSIVYSSLLVIRPHFSILISENDNSPVEGEHQPWNTIKTHAAIPDAANTSSWAGFFYCSSWPCSPDVARLTPISTPPPDHRQTWSRL